MMRRDSFAIDLAYLKFSATNKLSLLIYYKNSKYVLLESKNLRLVSVLADLG